MRQLYYTFRTLLRGRGVNLTKIISLTLGLLVGILLFARVAFELSFDGHYKEVDRLCVINAVYYVGGEKGEAHQVVLAPVPGAIAEGVPDEINHLQLFVSGMVITLFFIIMSVSVRK